MISGEMSMIVNTDMSEYWNGEAGRNWVLFQNRINASLLHFGEEVMATTQIAKGEQVLDIGCGCGDTTFAIAKRVGPFGTVHGIDISDVLLEKTKNKTAIHYNTSFDCADAQSHSLKPGVYNLAFSRFGVMFFNDPVMAFRNIKKSLLPGGRIAFICWQPIEANQWVNLPLQVAAKHLPLPAPSDAEEAGAFSFGEVNRVKRILSEAGFINTLVEPFNTKFNVGENLDEAVMFLTHIGPTSGAIETLDVDGVKRSRIALDLFEKLKAHKSAQGVELDAAAWIVTARIQ